MRAPPRDSFFVAIAPNVLHLRVEDRVVMRLVAETGDKAANGRGSVDHRRVSGPLHLPIEQGAEECLRGFEIAATDLKMNNGVLHELPRQNRILPRSGGSAITAGVCEKAIYRGYLQRQITALTRSVPPGIFLSAAFGAAHAYQGLQRASVIATSALLFGLIAQWRRTVHPGMIAHGLQDAVAPLPVKLMHHQNCLSRRRPGDLSFGDPHQNSRARFKAWKH
jgi:hypothetical protein